MPRVRADGEAADPVPARRLRRPRGLDALRRALVRQTDMNHDRFRLWQTIKPRLRIARAGLERNRAALHLAKANRVNHAGNLEIFVQASRQSKRILEFQSAKCLRQLLGILISPRPTHQPSQETEFLHRRPSCYHFAVGCIWGHLEQDWLGDVLVNNA